MEHLKRSHPFSRVMAKNVYNEYIGDRYISSQRDVQCCSHPLGGQKGVPAQM